MATRDWRRRMETMQTLLLPLDGFTHALCGIPKMRSAIIVDVCILQPCSDIVYARGKDIMKEKLYLQSTNRKDRYQSDLLSPCEVQTSNHWHWHNYQCKISDDIDARVRAAVIVSTCQLASYRYLQPHCELVDAFATRCVQYPEIMDRCTREDATKDCPAGVGNDDSQEDPACDLESSRGEDAPILEEN